jgi:hypothetical protein
MVQTKCEFLSKSSRERQNAAPADDYRFLEINSGDPGQLVSGQARRRLGGGLIYFGIYRARERGQYRKRGRGRANFNDDVYLSAG